MKLEIRFSPASDKKLAKAVKAGKLTNGHYLYYIDELPYLPPIGMTLGLPTLCGCLCFEVIGHHWSSDVPEHEIVDAVVFVECQSSVLTVQGKKVRELTENDFWYFQPTPPTAKQKKGAQRGKLAE